MALASIIDTSNKVPRAYIKVSLGVGPRSAGAAPLRVLCVGNKTAAGTKADGTVNQAFSPDEARSFWGAGSELALMVQAVLRAYPGATVSGATVVESAGTAATTTIVFTGTATQAGTVEVWVAGKRVVASFAVGDAAAAVATAVRDAILAEQDLPVTASAATGTTTITAKNKGPRGNLIRTRASKNDGAGITMTPPSATLAGGTTLDTPAAALAAAAPSRFHLIVAPYVTSTELNLFKVHCDTYAEPVEGKRQRFIAAMNDTLANTKTVADAVNAKRGQIAWLENSESPPSVVAATLAGLTVLRTSSDRSRDLNGEALRGVAGPASDADYPTGTEQQQALNYGITPLTVVDGEVVVVRSITNYHLNGTIPDYAVLDTYYVDVPDFVADTIEGNFAGAFKNFKLANDDPDEPPPAKTATPKTIRDWLYRQAKRFEGSAGQPQVIHNVDLYLDSLVVELDANAKGRANAVVPCDVIETFHQLGVDVQQNG